MCQLCKNTCDSKCVKKCEKCIFTIHKKDFYDRSTKSLSKTYVISKPGVYKLCDDVIFTPPGQDFVPLKTKVVKPSHEKLPTQEINLQTLKTQVNKFQVPYEFPNPPLVSAILVNSSNVVLDLGGHHLSQGNLVKAVIGIELVPDNQNIVIKNGTVEKFTGAAIHSYIPTCEPQPNLKELLFSQLKLIDNGGNGDPNFGSPLAFATGLNLYTDLPGDEIVNFDVPKFYQNIVIENCDINRNTFSGMCFFQSINVVIKNTHCNDTFISDEADLTSIPVVTAGMYIRGSENLQIENSTFNGYHSLNSKPPRILGFWSMFTINNATIINCRNVIISNTQMNGANISAAVAAGLAGAEITGLRCINSQFNNITGINVAAVNGFHNSDQGDLIIEGQGTSSNGHFFSGCQFNQIQSKEILFGGVEGFLSTTWKNILLDSCQITGCVNNSFIFLPSITTRTSGLLIFSSPSGPTSTEVGNCRNVVIKNCQISDIQDNSSAPEGQVSSTNGILIGSGFQQKVIGSLNNATIKNCDISNVSTIREGQTAGISLANTNGLFTKRTYVSTNRICDIHNSNNSTAGILLSNVNFPNVTHNNITDADNGIRMSNSILVSTQFSNTPNTTDILTASIDSNLSTITFNPNRLVASEIFTVGQTIEVAGFVPVSFNGPFTVSSIVGDSITYNVVAADTEATTLGSITITRPSGPANGVICQNKVDNCSVSGYTDLGFTDGVSTTTSAWTENQAFNCGSGHSDNYNITWVGVPPVQEGSIGAGSYPTGSEKWFNLSLTL